MSYSEKVFLWVLVINTVIAVIYLLWGIFFHKKNELGENERIAYIIRAVCILICPVVGIMFFVVGMLIKIIFFRAVVNLDDVIFSKERVKQTVKADEERERNIVPIQDALAVSDKANLRHLMLNVLKGDISESLATISLSLDSEDSETSHYAATALSQELNTFRMNVRKLQNAISKDLEENEDDSAKRDEYGKTLIDYMDKLLKQQVFTKVEQDYFVKIMADVGEMVYQDELLMKQKDEEKFNRISAEQEDAEAKNANEAAIAKWIAKEKAKLIEPVARARGVHVEPEPTRYVKRLSALQYSSIAMRLIEIGNYTDARIWCDRAMENFPNVLESYQCMMKLMFVLGDNEGFFRVLDRLKESKISIDSSTLEMIRLLS